MFAYVSVTLLDTVTPEDYGLDENCTEEEFEAAIEARIRLKEDDIEHSSGMNMNDIEIDVMEGDMP